MRFVSLEIKNFRNFDSIKIDLGNKNVFFGMNDIGKTNLLYALRFMFDRDMRKHDIIDSDYHKRNVVEDIAITVCIDISEKSPDVDKLRAKLKGAIGSADEHVFIKFVAKYDNQVKCAEIFMLWGGNVDALTEIHSTNGYFDTDYLFNVIYINSYVDLHELFKKNIRTLIQNHEDSAAEDDAAEQNIKIKVDEINKEISKLSGVQAFQDKLTPSYRKMRDENISITVKSDFAINYLYSNIVPFIHQDGDDNEYPTAGEGRKKLLAYSVYDILSEETAERKINLFLVEEPETHLHKSMQSALSNFLFNSDTNDNKLNYLFISTHSPYILSEMDDVRLIRLYCADKVTAASELYVVPEIWKTTKKKLNRALSEAIFADRVLLVEGESECILFECVLTTIDPYYESKGVFVLSVEGIGFKLYIDILSALHIRYIIKTDNDIFKVKGSNPTRYRQSGFSRVNGLIRYISPQTTCDFLDVASDLSKTEISPHCARKYYDDNVETMIDIQSGFDIYLSHCDLEEDLNECLGEERLCELLDTDSAAECINRLKSKKQHIMAELSGKFAAGDCQAIYEHENFACLKAVHNESE